ncbi:Os02g0614800 [Oryza sativa Japonica Group]|uniref:Os02g0614800 protein n=1 Tax=Oryza sativa subsp. japonica TaxID=39947 RepID=A0A0P0VLL6_ORYSJ|nr:Os02g0614800 [Oryza sativa Japonica Group]
MYPLQISPPPVGYGLPTHREITPKMHPAFPRLKNLSISNRPPVPPPPRLLPLSQSASSLAAPAFLDHSPNQTPTTTQQVTRISPGTTTMSMTSPHLADSAPVAQDDLIE